MIMYVLDVQVLLLKIHRLVCEPVVLLEPRRWLCALPTLARRSRIQVPNRTGSSAI